MEVFATISTISSVVQLVDFSGKCISKSVELYRSNNGNLDDNEALEVALNHLVSLKDEVTDGASSTTDDSLRTLCDAVASSANELAGALQKLKVPGDKTKWKTVRKALRTVWSKEKVLELEHRLSRFRDELNLHFAVKTREQLAELKVDLTSHFKDNDESMKEVIHSILEQKDLFAVQFVHQNIWILTLLDGHSRRNQEYHVQTREEVNQGIAEVKKTSQAYHRETKETIAGECQKIEETIHVSQDVTVSRIESVEVAISSTVELSREAAHAQQEETQAQIAGLEEAIRLLSQQMKERDEELKKLLLALGKSKNPKKRKTLGERSNALTAALLALETIRRYLQDVLLRLRSTAKDIAQSVQSVYLRKIIRYVGPLASLKTIDEPDNAPTSIPLTALKMSETQSQLKAHYSWIREHHGGLVNESVMMANWQKARTRMHITMPRAAILGPLVDPSNLTVSWLFSSIIAVLHSHSSDYRVVRKLLKDACSLRLRMADWVMNNKENLGTAYLETELNADIRYWEAIADFGGLFMIKSGSAPWSFSELSEYDRRDINVLLGGLIGYNPTRSQWSAATGRTIQEILDDSDQVLSEGFVIRKTGPAVRIVENLMSLGLNIEVDDDVEDDEEDEPFKDLDGEPMVWICRKEEDPEPQDSQQLCAV